MIKQALYALIFLSAGAMAFPTLYGVIKTDGGAIACQTEEELNSFFPSTHDGECTVFPEGADIIIVESGFFRHRIKAVGDPTQLQLSSDPPRLYWIDSRHVQRRR